jgi:hypothetical protein
MQVEKRRQDMCYEPAVGVIAVRAGIVDAAVRCARYDLLMH